MCSFERPPPKFCASGDGCRKPAGFGTWGSFVRIGFCAANLVIESGAGRPKARVPGAANTSHAPSQPVTRWLHEGHAWRARPIRSATITRLVPVPGAAPVDGRCLVEGCYKIARPDRATCGVHKRADLAPEALAVYLAEMAKRPRAGRQKASSRRVEAGAERVRVYYRGRTRAADKCRPVQTLRMQTRPPVSARYLRCFRTSSRLGAARRAGNRCKQDRCGQQWNHLYGSTVLEVPVGRKVGFLPPVHSTGSLAHRTDSVRAARPPPIYHHMSQGRLRRPGCCIESPWGVFVGGGPQLARCLLIHSLFLARRRLRGLQRNPCGLSDGHGWVRTSDLSRVKRALSH